MPRELKNEIKFKFQLCEEQKEGKRLIINNEIIIVTGSAGTGKTSLVAQTILDMMFKRDIHTIKLSRPTVEVGKSLGLLPGSWQEKVSPYNNVMIQTMKDCYRDPTKIEEYITKNQIIDAPIQFIRGSNILEKEVLVVDEVQSTTPKEMEAILTRLSGGKIILLGDRRQADICGKTGLDLALELSEHIEGIKHIHLVENHRSGIVKQIIDHLYAEENAIQKNVYNKEKRVLP